MKIRIKFIAIAMLLICSVVLVACKDNVTNTSIKIRITEVGWVNTPTDENDPYRKYLKDKYNADVILTATTDFTNTLSTQLGDREGGKPDLVSFPSVTDFRNFQNEDKDASSRPMILDWKPYLDKMPNIKKIIESYRVDGKPSIAEKMLTDSEGRLTAIWTMPEKPTWSLKIREDWAIKFRATAGKSDWLPKTPQDLLDFAQYIKTGDPDSNGTNDTYAFTADGKNGDFGVTGTWIPLMFGKVNIVPWGIYLDSNNQSAFGVETGSHKAMLDYMRELVSSGYMDPTWTDQSWSEKTKTREGKIGIEWYPSSISEEMQANNKDKDTLDWWKTYDLPSDSRFPNSGKMPIEGYTGKILSVSKVAALSVEKMDIICKLINDIAMTIDTTKAANDPTRYRRPATYDALRWGVGVEDGLVFQEIEGSSYSYINTNPTKLPYRQTSKGAGAWDWGAFFSNSSDGVIQGTVSAPDKLVRKILEHKEKTEAMATFDQIGAALKLDALKVANITSNSQAFEIKYVKSLKPTSFANYDDYYADYKTKWKTTYKGDELLAEAKTQFVNLGMVK